MDALAFSAPTTFTQLTLGLSLKEETTFDNFYAGKHVELLSTLKNAVTGCAEQVIYLCGAQGEGKSHLLQACCHYAHQKQQSAVYLPLAELLSHQPSEGKSKEETIGPELLHGLETLSLICLDDLHLVAGCPAWEEAIFHLYNRLYDTGGRIVIAARDLPKAIQLTLPDLVSRLTFGMVYPLQPLTDEEKLQVLMMRAQQRGIKLAAEVGQYILTHCSRQMNHLVGALNVLDKASLAAQRRLTIPFVKTVLHI